MPPNDSDHALDRDSLERRLEAVERELAGKDPAERLCWLRTDQYDWLGGASDAQLDAQPAVVPQWPAPRHDAETVADALTQSLDRHGIVADHLPEEKKDETRERIRTHERRR